MVKFIVWLCLSWFLFSHVELPHVTDWMVSVNLVWLDLLADFAPSVRLSLKDLAIVIALAGLASEVFSPKSGNSPWILNLRKHFLSEDGRVLSLVSITPSKLTAESDDYLQDICFVSRRFNGWPLISLVMLLVLGPAAYLIVEEEAPFMGIPLVVIAIVLLFILLRGKLTVGTADGDVMTIFTNKITAQDVCSSITNADASGFHQVSLSSPFFQKTVHMRKSRITGLATVSRFPLFFFLLFLASVYGAFSVFDDAPWASIVPVALLGIVIYLARKRTTVKLIGGHYCYLGSRESSQALLSVTTLQK